MIPLQYVILRGNHGMEIDAKITKKGNGVKQTEIIMAQIGKRYGELLNAGPTPKEKLLWSALNVDAVKIAINLTVGISLWRNCSALPNIWYPLHQIHPETCTILRYFLTKENLPITYKDRALHGKISSIRL